MKPAQLQALEEAINEKIRAHVPVTVQLLSIDDPAVEKVHLLMLKYCPLAVRSLTQKSNHLTGKIRDFTCTVCYMMCVYVNQVRSRGLPEDLAGPIRIIDIEGIDVNMCCGTHVSNLSHLQVQLHTRMQT